MSSEYFANVIDDEIVQVGIRRGTAFKGKMMGAESSDESYADYDLYPQIENSPVFDPALQDVHGPDYVWDSENQVVNLVWTIIDKPLAELKEALLEQLNEKAKEVEEQGITLADSTVFKTDKITQDRLNQAVALSKLDTEITFDWKSEAGTFTTYTITEIEAVALEVGQYVQSVFTKEKNLTVSIMACTTVEELQAIDINVGW